jgi:hypothetical protein
MFGRKWWVGMALLAAMMGAGLTTGSGCKLIEDRQREREREREFEREQAQRYRGNPCCPNPCCPQPGYGGQPSGFAPQGYGNCGCP